MPNEVLKQKLADTVERFRKKGLYTHAFAATGHLLGPNGAKDLTYGDANGFFDLSSLSKAFCTTSLIFSSLNREQIPAHASLNQWFPDVDASPLKAFAHLPLSRVLAHTSGLPAWRNFYVCRLNDDATADDLLSEPSRSQHIINTLARVKPTPLSAAGDVYSDLGFILLGLLLEQKYEKRLDVLFADFLKNDLGIDPTTLAFRSQLAAVPQDQFITTGWCAVRRRFLKGEVHDENCAALGGVSGHSGLFATGASVITFMRALCQTALGQHIVSSNAKLVKPGNPSLLGYRQGNDEAISGFANGLSMGHWGFTGTGFWLCPKTHRYALFLTNRVVSGRISPDIKICRREVFTLLDELSR